MSAIQHNGERFGAPLHIALTVIPNLPRPLLSRLVARAIERLDELDGDPDLEDDDPEWVDDGREEDCAGFVSQMRA